MSILDSKTYVRVGRVTAAGNLMENAAGETEAILTIAAYAEGDSLEIGVQGTAHVWVDAVAGYAPCLLYVPAGSYRFPIPTGEATKGFAPGKFDGPQTVRVWTATREEIGTYRNLAYNPLDIRLASEVNDPDAPEWSNPKSSCAVEAGEVRCFPHAYANRVTRNEGDFFPRNAIDGIATPGGHGAYPYQSWGGAVHEDLSFTIYFGRKIKTDKLTLTLRSDYSVNEEGKEHDTYWHTANIQFSDGKTLELSLQKSSEAQVVSYPMRETEWVKLERLDPLQIKESQNFAALNQMEVWGSDV